MCVTDMILNVAMEQYYGVQKCRDKTLDNKPLKKLHEKAFTEVVRELFVCLCVVVPVFVCSMTVCLCAVRPVFVCMCVV